MHRIFRDHFSRKIRSFNSSSSSSSSSSTHNDTGFGSLGVNANASIEKELDALRTIIHNTQPRFHRDLPGHQHLLHGMFGKRLDRVALGIDCDEVYPGLFIGDKGSAMDKQFLQVNGITHVVNTADGNSFTQVNTGPHYYTDVRIKYMGLNVLDMPQSKICIHFMEAAEFIDRAIQSGGRVLVHCLMGISRSATIALAYLMIKRHMPLKRALTTVRLKRHVRPNDGFMRQLIDLEQRLRPMPSPLMY